MPILTGGIINYGQRTANPSSPTPTEGSQYWHTTENTQYIYDGTNWNPVKVTLPWDQENTVKLEKMRDKEPPNPFDEIQKQLKELFKDSNVKISAHGFPEGGQFSDEQEEIVNEI